MKHQNSSNFKSLKTKSNFSVMVTFIRLPVEIVKKNIQVLTFARQFLLKKFQSAKKL